MTNHNFLCATRDVAFGVYAARLTAFDVSARQRRHTLHCAHACAHFRSNKRDKCEIGNDSMLAAWDRAGIC